MNLSYVIITQIQFIDVYNIDIKLTLTKELLKRIINTNSEWIHILIRKYIYHNNNDNSDNNNNTDII